ncbi:MAG TPA: pirin family protein [Edaphocola sp.]|nr:pirin family protein [Edaphocola sp.]
MSKYIFHPANERGSSNYEWLQSRHSFSFGSYFNPKQVHFGALRVLNDDIVAPGMGFDMHPHDNMEIISIPLSGSLAHRDSMGNSGIIKSGDIQVMSAGTGVRHSEYNASKDEEVRFLQIWLFPNKRNVAPRYDQLSLDAAGRKNTFQQILSPHADDEGVWIHQNAWFHLSDLDKGTELSYPLKDASNGLYIFNLKGKVNIESETLQDRDAIGIWEIDNASVSVKAIENASLLLMEVPMA